MEQSAHGARRVRKPANIVVPGEGLTPEEARAQAIARDEAKRFESVRHPGVRLTRIPTKVFLSGKMTGVDARGLLDPSEINIHMGRPVRGGLPANEEIDRFFKNSPIQGLLDNPAKFLSKSQAGDKPLGLLDLDGVAQPLIPDADIPEGLPWKAYVEVDYYGHKDSHKPNERDRAKVTTRVGVGAIEAMYRVPIDWLIISSRYDTVQTTVDDACPELDREPPDMNLLAVRRESSIVHNYVPDAGPVIEGEPNFQQRLEKIRLDQPTVHYKVVTGMMLMDALATLPAGDRRGLVIFDDEFFNQPLPINQRLRDFGGLEDPPSARDLLLDYARFKGLNRTVQNRFTGRVEDKGLVFIPDINPALGVTPRQIDEASVFAFEQGTIRESPQELLGDATPYWRDQVDSLRHLNEGSFGNPGGVSVPRSGKGMNVGPGI
jgi:hypothetical protein